MKTLRRTLRAFDAADALIVLGLLCFLGGLFALSPFAALAAAGGLLLIAGFNRAGGEAN